ncbi:hypothetical protein BGX20_007975 [Mortierella sp. AD010]|nr:hypothetical protein BGX20_007975 [Mortierella sp. AD010]
MSIRGKRTKSWQREVHLVSGIWAYVVISVHPKHRAKGVILKIFMHGAYNGSVSRAIVMVMHEVGAGIRNKKK